MASPAAKKSRFSPTPVQLPSQPLPPAAALGSPPPGSSGTSDQVQSAVLRYIQKRRYAPSMTEAYQRLRTSTTIQPLDQYALRECLRSEASSVASLALSAPPQVDPLLIEQQYNKFKIWISESLVSFKPELAQLLYPMFTHLYLDLVLAFFVIFEKKYVSFPPLVLWKRMSEMYVHFEFEFSRQISCERSELRSFSKI